MHILENFFAQLRLFFPPDLTPSFLWAERVPLLQTVEIAAGAMVFSLSIGLLLALIIGARLPGSRVLYAALVTLRCIPDLTMAILFVVLVGIGPGAGMLAIAVYYGAAMGKVCGDLFVSADPGPVESLSSTGAGAFTVAFYGQLPLRLKDLLTYGAYDFECAMRASVIVGAVGAGGIGTELVGTINNIDYRHATTLILMLVALIAVFDLGAFAVRKYPQLLLLFLAGGLYSAWDCRPQMFAWSHTLDVLRRMWPPKLSIDQVHALPQLIGETLAIAFGGTALAVLFAIPLGAAAARNLAPAWMHFPVRRLLEGLRAIPEVIWGLLLVTTAGIGPKAGVFALALHSAGVFGKLYAESIENVQWEPVMALAATGGPRVAIAGFGLMPLAFPPMAIHTLFRFEWNIRAATIVGMIGAGGIGGALFNAQQQFFYDQMLAYLLITWVLVMLADWANGQVRKRWKVTEGQI
ncbi:MAG: phosphonate ABC transporter, permease protein PhnE [Acidobacteriia bacterium]|nr:phosphonate ABC transporter, permease protein PhnE [Terriglobia bacterium]